MPSVSLSPARPLPALGCLLLASSALVLPDRAASATTPPPPKAAYFNAPQGGNDVDPPSGPSDITTQLVRLVDDAVPGATIRIAMYFVADGSASDPESDPAAIIDALQRAVDRGVTVRAVVDDEWVGPNVRRIEGLDGSLAPGGRSDVEYCTDGCFESEPTAKMHDKFVLVDDTSWTPGTESVVASSSANWSDKQLRTHYHNDLLVLWDDPTLYQRIRTYWEELWYCADGHETQCNVATHPALQSQSGATGTSVHFFPQLGGDPQLTEVNNVSCAGGDTWLRVAMGSWSGAPTRGWSVARALAAKHGEGCNVQVLVPEDEPIVGTLADSGVPYRCLGDETVDDGGHAGPGVHVKQILVDGRYAGVDSRIVFTGSANLTSNALDDNDEIWVKVAHTAGAPAANVAVYEAYAAQFELMWGQGFGCAPAPLPLPGG